MVTIPPVAYSHPYEPADFIFPAASFSLVVLNGRVGNEHRQRRDSERANNEAQQDEAKGRHAVRSVSLAELHFCSATCGLDARVCALRSSWPQSSEAVAAGESGPSGDGAVRRAVRAAPNG